MKRYVAPLHTTKGSCRVCDELFDLPEDPMPLTVEQLDHCYISATEMILNRNQQLIATRENGGTHQEATLEQFATNLELQSLAVAMELEMREACSPEETIGDRVHAVIELISRRMEWFNRMAFYEETAVFPIGDEYPSLHERFLDVLRWVLETRLLVVKSLMGQYVEMTDKQLVARKIRNPLKQTVKIAVGKWESVPGKRIALRRGVMLASKMHEQVYTIACGKVYRRFTYLQTRRIAEMQRVRMAAEYLVALKQQQRQQQQQEEGGVAAGWLPE